jgi:hypothetical protein
MSTTMLVNNSRQLASDMTGKVSKVLLPRGFGRLCYSPPLSDSATYSVNTHIYVSSKDLTKLPPAVLAEALQATIITNGITSLALLNSQLPATAPAPSYELSATGPIFAAPPAGLDSSQLQYCPSHAAEDKVVSSSAETLSNAPEELQGAIATPASSEGKHDHHQEQHWSGSQLEVGLEQPHPSLDYLAPCPADFAKQQQQQQGVGPCLPCPGASCQPEIPVLVFQGRASLKVCGAAADARVELHRLMPRMDPFDKWYIHVAIAVS